MMNEEGWKTGTTPSWRWSDLNEESWGRRAQEMVDDHEETTCPPMLLGTRAVEGLRFEVTLGVVVRLWETDGIADEYDLLRYTRVD